MATRAPGSQSDVVAIQVSAAACTSRLAMVATGWPSARETAGDTIPPTAVATANGTTARPALTGEWPSTNCRS